MITELITKIVEPLNKIPVGLGYLVLILLGCGFLVNYFFIDKLEASDFATQAWVEVRDLREEKRYVKAEIRAYNVKKAEASDPAVQAAIDAQIKNLEIDEREITETITCIETHSDPVDCADY